MDMKKCVTCGESKLLIYFSKHHHYKDGFEGACKSCQSIRAKQYYKSNTTKCLKTTKDWQQSPVNWFRVLLLTIAKKRKFKFLPGAVYDLSIILYQRLIQNPFCPYTGQRLVLRQNVHLDHKIPLSKGGHPYDPGNLQLVSEKYNRLKFTDTDEELARHWKLTWIP